MSIVYQVKTSCFLSTHHYALTEADNQEIANLIKEVETLDSYENLLSHFYDDQSSEDKEIRNIKNKISKIDMLMNALAELKSTYETNLNS